MTLSGIKTWLPSDVRKQEFVTSRLITLYEAAGCEPIVIPTLVDLSVVEKANSKFNSEIFKLVDKDGKVLALRTEMTQPIAKAVASRASELSFPLKLYYNSSIFRYKGIATDDSREIQQIGIEFIGAKAESSDKEVLELLIKSAAELGIKDYQVTITLASIWQQIFSQFPSIGKQVYDLIRKGDLIGFKKLIPEDHALRALLTDDIGELEKSLGLDLSAIKALLKLGSMVRFDALQCPDIGLYTGLHFNLIVAGQGKLLAMGGRYDNLCKEFGQDLPAVGFAFYVPRLISTMISQGLLESESKSSPATKKVLKIAVSKGTLLDGAIEFLGKNGISVETGDKRKLILNASPGLGFDKIEILLVRGHDVPTYVEHGAADLGVVGVDTVIDSKTNVMRLKDLNYGHCKLCVCAKQGLYKSLTELPNYTRIATTFPNITKDFFDKRGLDVEIINLYGSVELGPLTELSDIIVDLVASGKTLQENGLEVISEIMSCTAILIANEASFKVYKDKFLML